MDVIMIPKNINILLNENLRNGKYEYVQYLPHEIALNSIETGISIKIPKCMRI